jgi:hypothetical protein
MFTSADVGMLLAEIDALRRELASVGATTAPLYTSQEREQLLARAEQAEREVERLKGLLPPTAHTGVRNGPGEGSWAVFAEKVTSERDEARAALTKAEAALVAVREAVGKTIDKASMSGNDLVLRFTDGTGIAFSDSGQSCCEDRYMTCDDDLPTFDGAKYVGAEVAGAPDVDDDCGVHEVQFLRIHTDRGDIVAQTHNRHNGYYGGFAVRCRRVR